MGTYRRRSKAHLETLATATICFRRPLKTGEVTGVQGDAVDDPRERIGRLESGCRRAAIRGQPTGLLRPQAEPDGNRVALNGAPLLLSVTNAQIFESGLRQRINSRGSVGQLELASGTVR